MILSNGLFLFISMFLLIFLPKVGSGVDLIALYGILLFALAVHSGTLRAMPTHGRDRAIRFAFLLCALVAWACFSAGVNGLAELYQPQRFAKCLFHFAGCYALVAFYYRFYRDTAATRLVEHFWLALVVHAGVMLLMFVFPSINQFFTERILALDESDIRFDIRVSGNRIGGLTLSWDAISGVQSLGLLLLLILPMLPKARVPHWLLVASVPLLLFSVAISGVTGIVILGVFALPTMLALGWKRTVRALAILGSAAVVTVVVGSMFVSYWREGGLRSTSIARTAYMIGDSLGISDIEYADKRAVNASDTIERIFGEMYFFPKDVSTWLVGLGGSGRTWQAYILPADPGPTLDLHNLGAVGFLLIYFFFFKQLYFVFRNRRRYGILWVVLFALPAVLLAIDAKVQYLFARNCFTIMSLAFLLSWTEYRAPSLNPFEPPHERRPSPARLPCRPLSSGSQRVVALKTRIQRPGRGIRRTIAERPDEVQTGRGK